MREGLWARFVLRFALVIAPIGALLILMAVNIGRALPHGDEMAYMTRGVQSEWDIYLMDVSHGLTHRLTRNAGSNRFPAWSADGRRLAFHSNRENAYYEIYVMDVDGRNLQRLTGENMEVYRRSIDFAGILGNAMASWSPDGEWIGFHSDVGGTWDLYRVAPTGEVIERLTASLESDIFISWSPDGTRLLFASSSPSETYIYLMNADGTNRTQITSRDTSAAGVSTPDASIRPPGQTQETHSLFATATALAPPLNPITPQGTPAPPPINDFHPEWSPDGARIVFHSDRGYLSFSDNIYVLELSSGQLNQLTNDFLMNRNPAWLRDGERLSFTGTREINPQIYIMTLNGQNLRRLTSLDSESDGSAWRP